MSIDNTQLIKFNNKTLTICTTPIASEGESVSNISCPFLAYGKVGYDGWYVKKVPRNKKMQINNRTFTDPLFGIKKRVYATYYAKHDEPLCHYRIVIKNNKCYIIKDELVQEGNVLKEIPDTLIAYGRIEHANFEFKKVILIYYNI